MTETTTKDQMVRTATALFQRLGYNAASWRRLVEEGGTPWGSAYHHFPGSKVQLGVAAIEFGSDVVMRSVERAFERYDDPADAIRWWFGRAGDRLRDGEFETGCPVATIALEQAPSSPQLTAACRAAFARWTTQVSDLLRARGYADDAAAALATATLTALEGGLLLARVYRSTDPMSAAADQVVALLRAARA